MAELDYCSEEVHCVRFFSLSSMKSRPIGSEIQVVAGKTHIQQRIHHAFESFHRS